MSEEGIRTGEAATAGEEIVEAPRLRLRGLRHLATQLTSVRVLLTAALTLAVLYTLAVTKTLVVPLMLSTFFGLGLNPVVAFGARIGLPRWLGSVVIMAAVGGAVVGGVMLLAPPAYTWVQKAPAAIRDFTPKLKPVTNKIDEATKATQSLVGNNQAHRRSTVTVAPTTITAWDVLAFTPRVIAGVLTVVLLVFFFLIFGDTMLLKLVEVSPSFASKRNMVDIVRSIQSEVSRYVFTAASINFTLGTLTALMLWWLKMPDPLLWGSIAGLANFIPYVGAISNTILIAIIGLMHFNDPLHALTPALLFAGMTALEGNVITPMIMGHRLRLSPVAILIWLLIWGWMWGVTGALLAVPMLTTVKLITERVQGWEWLAHIMER